MSRVAWPLRHNRPSVRIELKLEVGGQSLVRALLADSGAGSSASDFDLILDEDDCLHCGGFPIDPINLGGAYQGYFPRYDLIIRLPEVGFLGALRVVGVSKVPPGFDEIACFSFLNRFHYGNFGDPTTFGLANQSWQGS